MTPEEKARVKIDRWFEDAGWEVTDRDHYTPTSTAVAIREGLLENNLEADYFLFINGKAVGVLEAKRKEVDIAADHVAEQAEHYTRAVPNCYQTHSNPLPLVYLSNGESVLFKNQEIEDAPYDEINRIHSPKEIVKMLGIEEQFAGLPVVKKRGLRDCQYEAISELEKSYRTGQNRALMVLATGAGKTYTAVTAAYRFLNYAKMRRVLFLVDRNNLGKQAEGEFGTYRLTENGDPFNTIFGVSRLKSATIPKDANVVISTIQRLFAFLKGEPITSDNDDDEESGTNEEINLPPNPALPQDYFDLIIIDECHRSIYGNWKKVLEYFNTARLIGLTATPVPETKAFFNNNIVVNYTLEKSIVDGVNVGARIYRIKTKETEEGGAIRIGDKLRQVTRYTGKVETITNRESQNYTKEELNRSIINPAQIKLILQTYKDAVYSEMFTEPQREANFDYLPKTLIFALNEAHANNIVKIAEEVFGKEDDDKYVQKITYSSGDSDALIRSFRNDKDFRIAVTCTLVATGTDVKPLEVLMFMRDVRSEPLYIQMKGRGTRTIGDDVLRNVTPNAFSKDCFFLVDAVGVTESEKTVPAPGEDEGPTETITFKKLLERMTHGELPDGYFKLLAARLARISTKCTETQRNEFTELTHGTTMADLSERMFKAIDPETSPQLPPYRNVNDPNLERKGLFAPLANNPKARELLLILNAGFIKTIIPGEDTLISKGFSMEEAQETASAFEEYCKTHADEIEALRIIYNNSGEPLTYSMLRDLSIQLLRANSQFNVSQLWNCYSLLNREKVKPRSSQEEKEALTNIIQLVRFALGQIDRLDSLCASANQYFNLWYGQLQRNITEKQIEVIKQVVRYIASNGAVTIKDIREEDKSQAAQLVKAFGNLNEANQALLSLAGFIIYHRNVA